MRRFVLIALIFFTVLGLRAQTKTEREVRIKAEEVPVSARDFVDEALRNSQQVKVRWYREYFTGGSSIEAKYKYQGKRYSIEFSSEGKLEDIEVEISWTDIPSTHRNLLRNSLDNEFLKWKISKVQEQRTGMDSDLSRFISDNRDENLDLKYEIVIRGKTEEEVAYFELLIGLDGEVLKQSRIVENRSDILIY
jgi:hypothetical protein